MILYLPSLFGGMLLGLSAVVLLLISNGQLAGISGIVGDLLGGHQIWTNAAFIVGLLLGPLLYAAAFGQFPAVTLPASWQMVCVSRVACRLWHKDGLRLHLSAMASSSSPLLQRACCGHHHLSRYRHSGGDHCGPIDMISRLSGRLGAALLTGAIFGFGLSLSEMIDPARVLGFLDLASGHWDPSVAFVLGGALLVAVPGVLLQRRMAEPVLDVQFHVPQKAKVDVRLLAGSAMFVLGWGLVGFRPGPHSLPSRWAGPSSCCLSRPWQSA